MCYGLRGRVYHLLKSYLSNRKQRVDIDGVMSDLNAVTYGVPQGTVLGPLLFTIYINDLLTINTNGSILSFADDTAVWYESESWTDLKIKAENDFKNMKIWFQQNKLTLNIEKTKYLPFSSYVTGLPSMGPLTIDENTEIPEEDSVKYLGIIIDRHARWNLQTANIVKKIRGLLPRFKYLRDFLDIHHLKMLYYSLVQSQLNYGIIGWGGVSDNHLQNLNIIQKWIIKLIYKKNVTYPSDQLFKESGLMDVRQLFCLNILLKTFQKKYLIPEPVSHTYSTRNKDNYMNPRSIKTVGQRNFNYLASRLYNILPNSVKSINVYNSFKFRVKLWIHEMGRDIFHKIISHRNEV